MLKQKRLMNDIPHTIYKNKFPNVNIQNKLKKN